MPPSRRHPKRRKYKNLLFLTVGIIVAIMLARYEPFHQTLLGIGELGYIGAFLAGLLFVISFTAATGIVVLLVLAEQLSAVELGVIAGFGAVTGDFLIFKFVKNDLADEISDIYHRIGGGHFTKLFHSRYFSWTLPLVGAAIIASPVPDELGVSLLGLSKMKTYQFVLLSFILNAIGIFLVVSASVYIKP